MYKNTHCNALQHAATHCNKYTLANPVSFSKASQHTMAHCNTLQYTASRCSGLQHTVVHALSRKRTLQYMRFRANDFLL